MIVIFPELDSILSKYNFIQYDMGHDGISFGTYSSEFDTPNIFNLILNPEWNLPSVKTNFINNPDAIKFLPPAFRDRLRLNPNFNLYLSSSDSTSINIFSFNSEDLNLINQFLLFKNQDPSFNFASINFANLSDSGINIYYMLDIEANNNYFTDNSNLKFNNILSRILYFILIQRKLDYLQSQTKTFLISNEL